MEEATVVSHGGCRDGLAAPHSNWRIRDHGNRPMSPRAVGALVAIAIMIALAAPTASSAVGNWTLTQLPARTVGEGESDQVGLSEVSCPSKSLCVAVSGFDTVISSRSPTGGATAWHVVTPPEPTGPGACMEENAAGEKVSCGLSASLRSISCPSENLCVAVSWEGFAYVSTDPSGGAGTWSTSDLNEDSGGDTHLDSVSCPSRSLCVAVSTGRTRSGPAGGRILTTADPTSGHWQAAQLDGSLDFTSVSCGSPQLCVAVTEDGRIVVSSDPTGGVSAWRVVGGPKGAGGLGTVACAQNALCVAGDAGGNLLASTAPGAPGATWTATNGGGSVLLTGVSCPTATRCVAVDNNGDVLASINPAGGAGSWQFENLAPFHQTGLEGEAKNALFGVSCASPTLCVLVGADSRIFTSTEPFPPSISGPPPPILRIGPRGVRGCSSGGKKCPFGGRSHSAATSAPASASTRVPRSGASNAGTTTGAGAAAIHHFATGSGMDTMCCVSVRSARPACEDRQSPTTSASATRGAAESSLLRLKLLRGPPQPASGSL